MEKMEKTSITVQRNKHHFYCDDCETYLGESIEYGDGYYNHIGEVEIKFYIDGWYEYHGTLCDTCRNKFITNLKGVLINLGFEK